MAANKKRLFARASDGVAHVLTETYANDTFDAACGAAGLMLVSIWPEQRGATVDRQCLMCPWERDGHTKRRVPEQLTLPGIPPARTL
jgi:hypothetical protein